MPQEPPLPQLTTAAPAWGARAVKAIRAPRPSSCKHGAGQEGCSSEHRSRRVGSRLGSMQLPPCACASHAVYTALNAHHACKQHTCSRFVGNELAGDRVHQHSDTSGFQPPVYHAKSACMHARKRQTHARLPTSRRDCCCWARHTTVVARDWRVACSLTLHGKKRDVERVGAISSGSLSERTGRSQAPHSIHADSAGGSHGARPATRPYDDLPIGQGPIKHVPLCRLADQGGRCVVSPTTDRTQPDPHLILLAIILEVARIGQDERQAAMAK